VRTLVRDGVRLAYEEAGPQDGPAILFVHGWTCNRSHFGPQVERFAAEYRCISVDLRGHGMSDAPEQEYTIGGFADDVGWIADQLGVRAAILVGHSMGGSIALALAQARPALARAVALLDPAILFPPALQEAAGQLADAFAAPDGMDAVRAFERGQFFGPSSAQALVEHILDEACRTPQAVVASAMRNLVTFDGATAIASIKVPLMYVAADRQLSDVARLRELAPDAWVGGTVGSGHFHQLEVPEQINAMLARFFAVHGL
jgi:pimeloyl-ACP methyl ester carboxylesterase